MAENERDEPGDVVEGMARVLAALERESSSDKLEALMIAWLFVAADARNQLLPFRNGFRGEQERQVKQLETMLAAVRADSPDVEGKRLWPEGDFKAWWRHTIRQMISSKHDRNGRARDDRRDRRAQQSLLEQESPLDAAASTPPLAKDDERWQGSAERGYTCKECGRDLKFVDDVATTTHSIDPHSQIFRCRNGHYWRVDAQCLMQQISRDQANQLIVRKDQE